VQEAFGGTHLQALHGQHAIGQVVGVGPLPGPRVGTPAIHLPLLARYRGGQLAVAMAGRFTNGPILRRELKEQGAVFTTVGDAEVLLHLIARSGQKTLVNRLVDALWRVEGGFALLVLSEDKLIAVRDPHGFRPLVRGRLQGSTVLASEDGPVRFLGGEIRGEVQPGQMVVVDALGESALMPFARRDRAACIQEPLHLAGVDAHVFGQATYPIRVALGERLAREAPCPQADVVVGLPGAGAAIATGYGRVADKPVREGLVPAIYAAGRRYVEPPREIRDFGARLQWTPVPAVVDGQVVALVVAAVAQGDIVHKAVRLLENAGAKEIHVRVASPPLHHACPYGVTSPTTDELASQRLGTPVDVSRWLGADSLGYLSAGSLHAIVGRRADGHRQWCDGCFSGQWPVVPVEEEERNQLDLFGPEPAEDGPEPA